MDSTLVDLEEVDMMDWCTRLQGLYKVVLPLALPCLVGAVADHFASRAR